MLMLGCEKPAISAGWKWKLFKRFFQCASIGKLIVGLLSFSGPVVRWKWEGVRNDLGERMAMWRFSRAFLWEQRVSSKLFKVVFYIASFNVGRWINRLKSLDRFWNQWWSMLFNSMTREQPYHALHIIKLLQALHGCLQLISWDSG